MNRALVVLGLLLVLVGIAWPWLRQLPLGRLPGDLVIERPGLRVFVPVGKMILVSLVLSLALWLWRK
jgi:hypothetical protein